MGFENEINEAVRAARDFVSSHDNVQITLFGDEAKLAN